MIQFTGKSVCKGIALGPVRVWKKPDDSVERGSVQDTNAEIGKVLAACAQAKQQLKTLSEKALEEVGKEGAAILEAQRMILEDEAYLGAIRNKIRTESVCAAYAVAAAGKKISGVFAQMQDEEIRERAADVKDVSDRLLRILKGNGEEGLPKGSPSIIVAKDLRPSETVQMETGKVLGLVMVRGSANSHVAILARMKNIPTLTGVSVDLKKIRTGMEAVVDAFLGKVIFEPDEAVRRQAKDRMEQEGKNRLLLEKLKGQPTVTWDGRRIRLCANIGSVGDVACALENDAEGIGLFRSEFLYLGRDSLPAEEEQFLAYRQALERMAGKTVVIRTMDIGADKQAGYLGLEKEENPAMGYRAIRICLKQPGIFKTQLRALLRAAVYGDLAILYPMITSVQEVRQIFAIVGQVQAELDAAGILYKCPRQGVMIETPAAVMVSGELAGLADFFSIGTNDLIQYTLAVDRQNEKLADFYDPYHPAVLEMIRMVVKNAHARGKQVGICGELGADLRMTGEFIRMGVDELSVAPSMILPIRQAVRDYAPAGYGSAGDS